MSRINLSISSISRVFIINFQNKKLFYITKNLGTNMNIDYSIKSFNKVNCLMLYKYYTMLKNI